MASLLDIRSTKMSHLSSEEDETSSWVYNQVHLPQKDDMDN